MKRIIYSSVTKFLVFLLMLVCTYQCMSLLTGCFVGYFGSDRELYAFEESFENSHYLFSELNNPIMAVHTAFYNVNSQDVDFEMTLEEALGESLEYIDKSEKNQYIIRIDGSEIKSSENLTPELIMSQRFFSSFIYDGEGYADYTSSSNESYYWHDLENIAKGKIEIYSSLDEEYVNECEKVWKEQRDLVLTAISQGSALILIFIALLVYLIAVCGKKADGEYKGMWIDKIPIEIHVILIALFFDIALCLFMICFDEFFSGDFSSYIVKTVILSSSTVAMAAIITSLLSLVRKIKNGTFIATSIIAITLKFVFKYLLIAIKAVVLFLFKLLKKIGGGLKTAISVFTGKTALILLTLLAVYTVAVSLLFFGAALESPFFLVFLVLVFALAVVFVASRVKDFEEISKGVKQIREGNLSYQIPEPKSGDMKLLAESINEIAKGLDESVSAKLRAERLKTELITNVSHDLKTPLTSIINYTELLSKVDGLPEEASDYVSIIAKKSDRLKTLTQDLFDISKVQSGNETINFERLDASLLINQSLGEHDGEIAESGLKFCVDTTPDLYISADGRKMSRVVGNLLGNILKYTMKGTRVFISSKKVDGKVVAEFKNVASYPMEFDSEEIIGRFVRGDKSRTEDGNGLGLAIAKSYTEACGGKCDVVIDGDLFKVVIKFDLME